jgi:hypothetical protein
LSYSVQFLPCRMPESCKLWLRSYDMNLFFGQIS